VLPALNVVPLRNNVVEGIGVTAPGSGQETTSVLRKAAVAPFVEIDRLNPAAVRPFRRRRAPRDSAATRRKDASFAAGKRAIDVAASLAMIFLMAPLLLLTAIAIRLDSKGPILYRQKRVGTAGKIFEIYKFRSMRIDAEKNGPQWAKDKDSRVTRVGAVIRKIRLDEVPQVINVLRGEMSFVGPRPERPEFVSLLEREIPDYHRRHDVKPGITGWAQVRYVYAASVDDARVKLVYDLEYIRNMTLWRDLFIIALTIKVVMLGVGSR
jgi:exopolysaccharide biosynthesis polyprenyl glycosylphosphotransferase